MEIEDKIENIIKWHEEEIIKLNEEIGKVAGYEPELLSKINVHYQSIFYITNKIQNHGKK